MNKLYHSQFFSAVSIFALAQSSHIYSVLGPALYKTIHKEKVLKIALNNMTSLASISCLLLLKGGAALDKEYERILQQQIVPALDSDHIKKCVYLDQDPVGFVTWQYHDPVYRRLMPDLFGQHATIHHLAVAETHRNKGYGSHLIQVVLDDCRKNSIDKITLWTTNPWNDKVKKFYEKFGFEMTHRSHNGSYPEQYSLRLRRHPIKLLLSGMHGI